MAKSTLNGAMLLLLLVGLIIQGFAQGESSHPFAGAWINMQYEYFRNQPQSEVILFRISPWFIEIDSSDKCIVDLLYEQRAIMGYPTHKYNSIGTWEYQNNKNYKISLSTINDSLLVYCDGVTPGAGIIFKRVNKVW